MSIINFSSYQVPDVYVTQVPSPIVNIVGTTPAVIAIVGPTRGYKTFTEPVTLSGTTAVTLSNLGVNPATVVIQDASGNTYTAGVDYATATVNGIDAYHNQVTVARSTPSGINSGVTVFATYQYTDFNYYTPQTFFSFAPVQSAFGQAINLSTNTITSPVSLAALQAFNNGANEVVICPTLDSGLIATRTGLSNAYTLLASDTDIDIVVPLPVGLIGTPNAPGDIINIGADLKAHCESLAALGVFRTGIIGYETSSTVLPDVIAGGIASARVMEAFPNQMNFFNSTTNQTLIIAGYYLAAAFAGRFSALPVQESLTRKSIIGFSGIPSAVFTTMTKSYKNQLSAAGVAVVEPSPNGSLICRHGVTTLGTSVMTQELSLVRCADRMVQQIHDTLLNSGLIGSPQTPTTLSTVKGIAQGVLDSLKNAGVIFDYTGLGVQTLSTNPTVIALQWAYKPSYPLNYITAQFSIDTTSGSIAPITQGAGQTTSVGA